MLNNGVAIQDYWNGTLRADWSWPSEWRPCVVVHGFHHMVGPNPLSDKGRDLETALGEDLSVVLDSPRAYTFQMRCFPSHPCVLHRQGR